MHFDYITGLTQTHFRPRSSSKKQYELEDAVFELTRVSSNLVLVLD